MRGQKTLKIEGRKDVVVKELTFMEIKSIFELDGAHGSSTDALLEYFGGHILPLVTNLTLDELKELAPSELKGIWDAVKEVNAVFFDIARQSGALEYMHRFKQAILQDCLSSVLISLSTAIPGPSTTDTPTSSVPQIPCNEPSTNG